MKKILRIALPLHKYNSGQIKKNPVFSVTQPDLNLLVKPRIFSGFLKKYIIVCILKGEMPFKMHKMLFSSRKKICVPILPKIFRPVTRNIHFTFLYLTSSGVGRGGGLG